MIFNEDSRVKIPALLHFTRLGYRYLPQRRDLGQKLQHLRNRLQR